MSSANNISSKTFDTLHRSFIHTKNNRGPKIDPPQVISNDKEL